MLQAYFGRLARLFSAMFFISVLLCSLSISNAEGASWEKIYSSKGKICEIDRTSPLFVEAPFGNYKICRFRVTNPDKSFVILNYAAMLNVEKYAVYGVSEYDSNGKNKSVRGSKVPKQNQFKSFEPGSVEEVLYNAALGRPAGSKKKESVPNEPEKPAVAVELLVDAYAELINSLPAVGEVVSSIPSYAQAFPPMGYGLPPQVIKGNYGGLKFTEVIEGGRVKQLQIAPEAGSTDTTSIADSVVDELASCYGPPIQSDDGNYVWANSVIGSYSPRNGIVSLQM